MADFARQLVLQGLGDRGQRRLAESTVLVAGLGGTGCSAAESLALAGVGRLVLVDRDVVAAENLHRQHLYTLDDIGRSKAEVAVPYLKSRAPTLRASYHAASLDASNAAELLEGADLAVDCLDNLESRLALNHGCVSRRLPLVHTAALGWEGSVAVFRSPRTACFECLSPPAPGGALPGCEEVGALGAVTSSVGSMGALEAVKLIAGVASTLTGRILVLDFLRMEQHTAAIARRGSCGGCGRARKARYRRELISLCGRNEYYASSVYRPGDFPRVVASLGTYRVEMRGESAAAAVGMDGVEVTLFRGGGVLLRGVSSASEARRIVEGLV